MNESLMAQRRERFRDFLKAFAAALRPRSRRVI